MIHRAAALAGLLGERDLIAVAGTHGKTTTTGMAVAARAAPGRTRPGRSARPYPIWAATPASGSDPAAAARTAPPSWRPTSPTAPSSPSPRSRSSSPTSSPTTSTSTATPRP
ncbi:hypothetical protein [Brachybacterium sp. GPGPB12]|uniref:hypothetical protein n=1 Tax=Brachybacterium sp. GPGPB12 TaxID=3023517 RepID=UPI003134237E